MKEIESILKQFPSISLQEIKDISLSGRYDRKFIFEKPLLKNILNSIAAYYKILETGDTRLNKYETLYYDTPDFELYKSHHNGKLNRYKIRTRKYVDSGICYFEIKSKNNKGQTSKDRLAN